ncbi:hypothetical protein BGX26_011490 [Mortierella sp. AD094]|nr:hypothetical protein BGX26_011490 [Mortierella sp. AD094]
MHASLVEKDTREDVLLIKDTRSKEDMHLFKDNRTKATTGSSVSSLYPLKDFEDNGTESGFFVFPDLSVRMEGTYRLKFCLYEMVGKDVHFCAYIISDPLVVYSAKKFPGMEESTQLSQYFAEQGLKIRIRKEVRPKKRSRGEYITAPSSHSPAGSLHQDTGDAVESQDDDDPSTPIDAPLTSKRRASGTRIIESRRDDHPMVPQKAVVQFDDMETRSNPTSRSSGLWRGQAPEHPEYQSMSNVVDRPGPTPESYPQQHGYFRDNMFATRRVSATNRATESASHMDVNAIPSYSSGARSEQPIDGGRNRPQDQVSATADRSITSPSSSRQESFVPYRAASLTKQPAALPTSSLDGQHLDQRSVDPTTTGHNSMGPFENRPLPGSSHQLRHNVGPSTGYHDETRHRSSTEIRSEPGLEHPFISDSRGVVGSQRYQREHPPNPRTLKENIRNPQTQPFTRVATMESSYSTYPSRQGYAGTAAQRPSDYGAPSAYMEDHQHGSAAPIPYDRSDHPSQPQPDALSQHKPSFHPVPQYTQHPSQHLSHLSRDLQYGDNQTYPPQDQMVARARPVSHHDSYSGFQHQAAPFPHSVSHGKYPAADAPSSSYAPQGGDHSQSGRYPPAFTGEAMAGQGRYPPHSHPSRPSSAAASAGHGRREDPEAPRRTSLTSSSPRSSDHRSLSMTHFARTVSTPMKGFGHETVDSIPSSGYTTFHRDRESDGASRHSTHPSSGHSLYQDGSPQSMSGSGIGAHHPRGNPSSGPYSSRPQESSTNVGKGALPRPASIEYGLEGHPPYGHGRSMSSSGSSRPPHVPVSAAATTTPPSAIRQGGVVGPGQSRGPGHYEEHEDMQGRHYTTVHPSPHDTDLGPYGGYSAVSAPGGVGGGGGGRSHEHGYKQSATGPPQPSSGLLPGHGLPGSHNYGQGNSYTNSKMGAGPSGHSHGPQHPQQFQAHGHQYQHYAGGPPQGHAPQTPQNPHSHDHGYEEQQHGAHGHPYPQK